MFSLTEGDLKKTILGCSDGPASFNAELTARGGDVISVDPAYQFDTLSLKKRILFLKAHCDKHVISKVNSLI